MKKYLELIRVKHWLKNGLIFLPIFFSINVLVFRQVYISFIAFLVFCFSSSIVYVINDINDIESDKLHAIKKNRPLASGKVSIKNAKITLIFLILCLLCFMIYLYSIINNIFIILIPLIYIVLNILYSKGFKNIPVIDVVILMIGFVLRIVYGGVATDIQVSKYLYLMIMFGSFYLGFGKRRNEINKSGTKTRKVLKIYNEEFLNKNMYVMLGLAIASYTLWCVDPATIAYIKGDYLFWTIPFVIVILLLYSLNIEGDSYGDPVDVILSDKLLFLMCVLYVILMFVILYML